MRTEKTEGCINIAVMISGEGTNAENIIRYFEPFLDVNISCVISNKTIDNRFKKYKIDLYSEQKWYKQIDQILTHHNVHYIVLAGYLDKLPPNFCLKYKWKIINIHPSLLPRHGGKGMYGDNVHQSVKTSGDDLTGISIHLVDEEYDSGSIIFQKHINVRPEDTWEDIKHNVRDLEYRYYPSVIEKFIHGTYKYLYEKEMK